MYDFQAAAQAAKEVVERSEGGNNKEYTFQLVYPQKGQKITVRPLFNPKSGQILRLVQRHEKIACYRTYGIECPICKIMQQVKDITGQDPFGKSKSTKSRGICFAQYVSSSEPIDKGNNKGTVKPGEIILLMFPWSVYTQISANIQTIAQTPTGMEQAFCHANTGMFIDISVSNDFKYTVSVNPYLTLNTGKTDEEFLKMLDDMESLYEQVLPSNITEEVNKQVQEYHDEIYKQFIEPRTPSAAPQSNMPQNLGQIPGTPQNNPMPASTGYPPQNYVYNSAQPQSYNGVQQMSSQGVPPTMPNIDQAQSGKPNCFGNHQNGVPQCIVCPCEMECISKS